MIEEGEPVRPLAEAAGRAILLAHLRGITAQPHGLSVIGAVLPWPPEGWSVEHEAKESYDFQALCLGHSARAGALTMVRQTASGLYFSVESCRLKSSRVPLEKRLDFCKAFCITLQDTGGRLYGASIDTAIASGFSR